MRGTNKTNKLQAILLASRALLITLLFFAAAAWLSTALVLARSVLPLAMSQQFVLAIMALAILTGTIWFLRRRTAAVAAFITRSLAGRGLMVALVVGLMLRLLWVLVFPAAPASDGQTYLALAAKLAAGEPYYTAGTHAYWPPGYAFFLSPWLLLMPAAVAVPASQLALFAIAVVGVHRLTALLATPSAAAMAAFLFAIWPNLVAHSATPEKEMLVAALLIWVFVGIVTATTISIFVAGVLLGGAMLVQPSIQLLIPAIGLLLVLRHGARKLAAVPILLLGAALLVAPWSIRNYHTFGEFKLVSTNGGDNLYRANNPLATGGYTERGAVDLSALNEIERDRVAKGLAFAWMRDYPAHFLALAVEKQVRFMGDDAAGVHATFRSAGEQRADHIYVPLKLAANLWWLTAWLAIAALIVAGASLGAANFLVWCWIYLFSLHSIFESAGKYHVPMLWVLCVVLGVLLARQADHQPGVAGSHG